jgi:hypothetical protein
MFNHHFFDAKDDYKSFISGASNLFIVMDPPFGGLIDALTFNLKRIIEDFQQLSPCMFAHFTCVSLIHLFVNS